jgi:DNA-binding NtrC family response regulator
VNDFDEDEKRDSEFPLETAETAQKARKALERALELLPRSADTPVESPGERSALRLPRRGDRPRILLVDDDEVIRRLMTKIIEGRGMSCVAVECAEEAIPIMEQELFDALVLDKNLPGMDGVELAGLARRIQPGVPVLMITGYSSEDSARQAAAYGVTDYILKPIDLAEFRQRLSEVVAAGPSEAPPAPARSEQPRPRETPRISSRPAPAMTLDAPFADQASPEAMISVLIVEPEHSVRSKLEAVLKPMGCLLSSFSEPHAVQLEVGRHPFELLVAPPEVISSSRNWLAGMGGWTLLGSIAIMDRGGVDKAIEAIHLGARGVVHPPFEPVETGVEFRRVVSALLEERRS